MSWVMIWDPRTKGWLMISNENKQPVFGTASRKRAGASLMPPPSIISFSGWRRISFFLALSWSSEWQLLRHSSVRDNDDSFRKQWLGKTSFRGWFGVHFAGHCRGTCDWLSRSNETLERFHFRFVYIHIYKYFYSEAFIQKVNIQNIKAYYIVLESHFFL